jgi:2-haloacid dehalogenase
MIARRTLLKDVASMLATGAVASVGLLRGETALAQVQSGNSMSNVKLLLFDMFGTSVDWRTGVAREAEAILKPLGYSLDWFAFADAWRAEYQPEMELVRSGRIPYAKLDVLHRRMLDRILPRFGVRDLSEADRHQLTFAWHRLDGWPDMKSGLARLGRHFMLAPCSNANFLIVADLAKRNGWRWDAVLGADIASDYKPKPRIYLASSEAFGLRPDECMMVSAAAHDFDHEGSSAVGMRSASIARPDEFGPGSSSSVPTVPVDIVAQNANDLADKLGA